MPQPDGILREAHAGTENDVAVGAGLDALDTPAGTETPNVGSRLVRLAGRTLPFILTIVVLIAVWQALWAAAIWDEFKLPAPKAVWAVIAEQIGDGQVFGFLWVSVHRAVIGFLIALA